MSDEKPTAPDPAADNAAPGSVICSWCSTVAPPGAERCASCGASLIPTEAPAVPGLTALDTDSLLRSQSLARQRTTRLLPFNLGGENKIEVPSEAELQSLAPPSSEVQLEIVRLELDAERQRLEAARAELESEAAEAALEAGVAPEPIAPDGVVAPPPGPEAAAPEGDQPAS